MSASHRWCQRITPKQWKRSPHIATDTLRAIVKDIATHSTLYSCIQLVRVLHDQYSISISRQLAHVMLCKTLGFSFKRTRKRGTIRNHDTSRYAMFAKDASDFECNGNLVAIDECGFDQRCIPVYAYAPKGQQAILQYAPIRDRRHFTLVMAIDSKGTHREMLLPYACNRHTFSSFISSLPFPPRTGIIVDNASIHKTSDVLAAARSKGYTLLFTPPYTPEANPIEMVFGNIKRAFYRLRYSDRFTDLPNAINQAVNSAASSTGIVNTFLHTMRAIEHWRCDSKGHKDNGFQGA